MKTFRALLTIVGLHSALQLARSAEELRPPTVRDSVLVREFKSFGSSLRAISPDGRKLAYILREANWERNINEIILYVIALDDETNFDPPSRGHEVFRTTEVYPRDNEFQWLADSRHVLILHRAENESRMIVAKVDTVTGQWTRAYQSDELDIGRFAANLRGDRLIVAGIVDSKSTTAPDEVRASMGIRVAPTDSAYRLVFNESLGEIRPPVEVRLVDLNHGETTLYRPENRERWSLGLYTLSMSKDGRHASYLAPDTFPDHWRNDPMLVDRLKEPSFSPGVLHLVDLPDSIQAGQSLRWRVGFDAVRPSLVTWSDDGASYLVRGPRPMSEATAIASDAFARRGEETPGRQSLYSVDAATGEARLVLGAPPPEAVVAFDEGATRVVALLRTGELVTMRRTSPKSAWTESSRLKTIFAGRNTSGSILCTGTGRMMVAVGQSPDSPPDLHLIETTSGKSRRITDVNPELRNQRLAKVERLEWVGNHGVNYWGHLLYPLNYRPGTRYPAAILLQGWDDTFIHGGQSHSSNFPPQALAAKDMFVLLLDHRGKYRVKSDLSHLPVVRAETLLNVDALYTARQKLTERNLIDPAKVGVMGFSYTSFVIDYLITHPEPGHPWAAAVSCDGGLYNYAGFFLYASYGAGMYSGPPYGETRREWEEIAPAFNAHRTRTPVMLQYNKGGPMACAEFFAALHTQGKPVEQFWFPKGGHPMLRPLERESSMQQAIDWFRFWLQDYERLHVPEDPERYGRWRLLRDQQHRNEQHIADGKDPTREALRSRKLTQ